MNGTDIIKGLVLLGAGAVVLMLVLWLLSAVLDEALEQAKRTLKSLQGKPYVCLLYTSPSPRDRQKSRMPSSA